MDLHRPARSDSLHEVDGLTDLEPRPTDRQEQGLDLGAGQQIGVARVEDGATDHIADVVGDGDTGVDLGVLATHGADLDSADVERLVPRRAVTRPARKASVSSRSLTTEAGAHRRSSGRAASAARTSFAAKWSKCSWVTSTAVALASSSGVLGVKVPGSSRIRWLASSRTTVAWVCLVSFTRAGLHHDVQHSCISKLYNIVVYPDGSEAHRRPKLCTYAVHF